MARATGTYGIIERRASRSGAVAIWFAAEFAIAAENIMAVHPSRSALIPLTLGLLFCVSACSRPPVADTSNSDSQKLPFDRQPHSTGMSPSQSLIPSTTKLPEGTPILIRLQSALSSATAHPGDTFSATVDEPVVVDGQTQIARDTPATGRVLEAKPSAGALEPGYLRIVLVSLNVGRRQIMIYTSSIFAKGGPREERNPPTGPASDANQKDRDKDKDRGRDIAFGTDRRLNFRLAQTVDLQQPLPIPAATNEH
jgi:hypothetical protein